MNQSPQNEPAATSPAKNDPNHRFSIVQALLERSVLASHQVHEFGTRLLSVEQHSGDDLRRFKMLPTEMIVAMHNLRQGVETALLTLAAIGLPAELQDRAKDIFIEKAEGESTDLDRLFEGVVEKGGPEGFVPVAGIRIHPDTGIGTDEYQGSLAFLKELTAKYQRYAFENVPMVLQGACHKGEQPTGRSHALKSAGGDCSQLQNPQPSSDAGINPEEVVKYQKMSEELIADANAMYGQFCAVGSVYLATIQQ